MQEHYRFEEFKKRNPEKLNILVNRIIFDLSELEKAVSLNMVNQEEAHLRISVRYLNTVNYRYIGKYP